MLAAGTWNGSTFRCVVFERGQTVLLQALPTDNPLHRACGLTQQLYDPQRPPSQARWRLSQKLERAREESVARQDRQRLTEQRVYRRDASALHRIIKARQVIVYQRRGMNELNCAACVQRQLHLGLACGTGSRDSHQDPRPNALPCWEDRMSHRTMQRLWRRVRARQERAQSLFDRISRCRCGAGWCCRIHPNAPRNRGYTKFICLCQVGC